VGRWVIVRPLYNFWHWMWVASCAPWLPYHSEEIAHCPLDRRL